MLHEMFLVRHAEPQRDTALDYRSLPGPDLTEHGRAEARQTAAFLGNTGVQHLFVSPFARTAQTAAQIVELLGIETTITSLIEEYARDESEAQLQERVGQFLCSLTDVPFRSVAVVTHASPIRHMLLLLTDGRIDVHDHPDDSEWKLVPTAGIWQVRRAGAAWQAELVFSPS